MNDGTPNVLLKQGDDAYGRGDYAAALDVYRSLAAARNSSAEYYLGVMCEFGHGVEKDISEAVIWYRKAAEDGSALAQLKLGLNLDEGLGGVARDPAEALRWYRMAAEHGHIAEAMRKVGWIYHRGNGVPQDHVQAFFWFGLAAREEQRASSENSRWYSEAKWMLDVLAEGMSAEQIAQAQALIDAWDRNQQRR
ncbi:MAG: tetratricopeptide repeat protein [Proteobacteria bacterium]|nr:tetratricopeptide repeat protein [Pseudomonadota bacterium]